MTQPMMTTSSVRSSLELFEVKPGMQFPLQLLREALPNAETALFFGKVYDLDYRQLSDLLSNVLNSKLSSVLFAGDHSGELQDYLVDICDIADVEAGDITFDPDVAKGEILPEVWKNLEVTVAQSIKDVANKLGDMVGKLPGKQGSMMFQSMMVMNRQRPTVGDYRTRIGHSRQKDNLLILDVSGSMSESTVESIVDDVVSMAYLANAHLAIVSKTTTHWEPGNYDSASVLSKAEFGGTHYETLAPLLNRDWGTVITVADYDSSMSAQRHIGNNCTGTIDEVIDVSLVNQPTFLAECVGQLAAKVTPVLIGQSRYVLS
jgi:hypothetical protein